MVEATDRPVRTRDSPLCSRALTPIQTHFHARLPRALSAFNSLGRELCGCHLGWLATHGFVGFSASYRLTNGRDGDGIAGCITDAWTAYEWLKAHAVRLRIDPKRILVMGDSAGGGLALALSTGLRPGAPPAPRAELPRAALVGYPVVTFDARQFLAQRSATARGGWVDTPAESAIAVPNIFLPPGTGPTAEAAQQQIRGTMAGAYYFSGQRLGGLLPADVLGDDDAAAAVSPLSLAQRRDVSLPPVLIMGASNDTVVPAAQQERFAEAMRRAGHDAALLMFHGTGDHGGDHGQVCAWRVVGLIEVCNRAHVCLHIPC